MAAVDMLLPDREPEYGYKTPEIQLSDGTILAPGFAQHLQAYMKKATRPEDQNKASDLINSLKVVEDLKKQKRPLNSSSRRPSTAMGIVDAERMEKVLNPYLTQYGKEYEDKSVPETQAERPKTSRAFNGPQSTDNLSGHTTYGEAFYSKNKKRDEPIRTGSASGNRRNNPHPPESFMVWKFAHRNVPEQSYSQWSTPLTDDLMDKVMRGKYRSTYQHDYLGIPQGFQMKDAISAPEDWKSKLPFTLDTCQRYSYQQPNQQPILKGNTTRYGCNGNKLRPAFGAVPTARSHQMHLKNRTTYSREFSDRVLQQDIFRSNQQNGTDYNGVMMEDILQSYPRGPPHCTSSRNSRLPAATEIYVPRPVHTGSTWIGPY